MAKKLTPMEHLMIRVRYDEEVKRKKQAGVKQSTNDMSSNTDTGRKMDPWNFAAQETQRIKKLRRLAGY